MVKPRSWLRMISAGGAGPVVAVVLTTGPLPVAGAQVGLADWLSRAAPPVEAIPKAENAAYALIAAPGMVDAEKLRADCGQLHEANEALRNAMPPRTRS